MIAALENHLWQSTLFAGVVALLTLVLRRNRAAVRHGLWLAASAKFLVPFSLLIGIGSQVEWRHAPLVVHPRLAVMDQISEPFASPAFPLLVASLPGPPGRLRAVLFGLWLCGVTANSLSWWRHWRRVVAALHAASPLALRLPIRVMSSPARLGPGVYGIRNPVLLLPDGITERLTLGQLRSILAHELCHVRRRDNLTAAIHMVVEALFWFHPLVWWIQARLVEERERACDEEVLRVGGDPQDYAAGILNICKFYLEPPLVCVSGVTGAHLKRRMEAIMMNRNADKLNFGRKLLLSVAGVLAVAGPLVVGVLNAPMIRAQSPGYVRNPQAFDSQTFEVASIKPMAPAPMGRGLIYMGMQDPGLYRCTNCNLRMLVAQAYDLQFYQLSVPRSMNDLMNDARFDISARVPKGATKEQTGVMLKNLLAERFKLRIHRESKEMPVYSLVIAKGGPKLKASAMKAPPDPDAGWTTGKDGIPVSPWPLPKRAITPGPDGKGGIHGDNETMQDLAERLSGLIGTRITDATGLTGKYDYSLTFDLAVMRGRGPSPTPDATSPFAAETQGDTGVPIESEIQSQLGLKLEKRKGPVEIVVVDHVEKIPTEN